MTHVICCTGTTAFPSKRWSGENTPDKVGEKIISFQVRTNHHFNSDDVELTETKGLLHVLIDCPLGDLCALFFLYSKRLGRCEESHFSIAFIGEESCSGLISRCDQV